jgi:hypothetical protein
VGLSGVGVEVITYDRHARSKCQVTDETGETGLSWACRL